MPFMYSYRVSVVLGTISLVMLLSLVALAQAETKTIVSEATYSMGDGETPSFAEAMVLQKAKQRALEEAGTYVESYTHVRNLDLTVDEIKTIAGGIMQTDIVEHNRALEGSGTRFYIKIRALVTTDKIEDLARRKQLGPLAAENKRLQDDVAKLTRDLEYLKRQILQSKTESEREVVLEKIRGVEKQFRQVRSTETALYRRLVSGEELSAQVDKAFREEQRQKELELKREERQQEALDGLLTTLKNKGHKIAISAPTTEVSLDQPDRVTLGFDVTTEATEETKSAVKKLSEAYRGNVPDSVASQIKEVLDQLEFILIVVLSDGREYEGRQKGVHNFRNPLSYDLKLAVQDQPRAFYIEVSIPRKEVSQVASVEGKIEVQAKPVAQPQRAAERSMVSDDLNRELEEELKKIKQLRPAAKLDIPAVNTPKTTLKISGMAVSSPYWARVQSIISSQWEPPPVDMAGQSYTMIVKFRLQRDGTIKGVVVQQSSGNAYFDMAGQRAVLRPRVLSPFPADMKDAYKDLEMVFQVGESLEGHR